MSFTLFYKNIKNNFQDFKQWIVNPTDELKSLRNNFLKYLLSFIILILFTVLFFHYSHNKIKFSLQTFIYTILIIIPIILLFYFLKPHLTNITGNTTDVTTTNEQSTITIFITLFVFIIAFIYFIINVTQQQIVIAQYLFGILLGLILIVGLAITFLMFVNTIKTMSGWSGFFMRLLFFIPCLFIDFIQFIKNEMKITANNIYILFILELLLILGYLYLPKLLKKIALANGIVILKDSMFLHKEFLLTNDKIIQLPKNTKDVNEPSKYRQNFAISMWVYVDPQSKSFKSYSKECNIIDMDNRKPKITYIDNNSNSDEKDKLIIYFGDNKHTISNKGQKWNNIVINCNSTIIDIFMNGNLEKTFYLQEPLDYTNTGKITLGSNEGLDGAICNIMYYNTPLTKTEIVNNYNLLMLNNPPIIE
jgi:hypothetical protein